jgi:hypothetical protein
MKFGPPRDPTFDRYGYVRGFRPIPVPGVSEVHLSLKLGWMRIWRLVIILNANIFVLFAK